MLFLQDRDNNPCVTGEEWLVKKVSAYLPGAYKEVVDIVGKDGKPQLGQKKLGEKSFLQPGERLERGIQNVFVLGEDQGLILKANEALKIQKV